MWRTRVIKKQLTAAVLATGLVAVAFAGPRASAATLGAAGAGTNPNCTTASAVANWPLSRRLAQLVMVDLNFGDPTAANYAAAGAGGFVFLGQPPAGSGPAIATQMQGLNATEAAAGLTKPLLSTDEEGGGVARLSNVIGALPWQRQQAAMWSPPVLQSMLAAHGAALGSVGINMDLAPVLDTAPAGDTIGAEGLRSYSEDGPTAAAYGIAAVHGLQAGGIVPVIKHFPGLGHANANTDTGPATTPPLAQLQTNDLIPFVQAVNAGAPVLMVSNALVPGLTNGLPASVAPGTYNYLRATVGFGGLAITDSLAAGAISAAGFTEATAAAAAVKAGADMVLIDATSFGAAVATLTQAVNAGTLPASQVNASVRRILAVKGIPACATVSMAATPHGDGYWLGATDGSVAPFGAAPSDGSLGGITLNQPIVGMARTPDGGGYWLVASDGGIFTFGDAAFFGSTGNVRLVRPIVGMASTPTGRGYWLVASDGGIFTFGDAAFFGSTGNVRLVRPIVGMASTPTGRGYWLVASDGGIFTFGDAAFFGSTGNVRLVRPIVGMASTPTGRGYWLVASDGGIFTFGDAAFFGSTGAVHLAQPIVGMASTPTGQGYWMVASDGGIFTFGDARFFGSTG